MFDTIVDYIATHCWLFSFAAILLLFLAYLGVFTPITVTETPFPGGYFFYKDLQVSTKKLGPVFADVVKDIEAYHKTQPKRANLICGGIFYDDPNSLVDENKMRLCAGVLVRASNQVIHEHFSNLGYKVAELPRVTSAYACHPMRLKKLGI